MGVSFPKILQLGDLRVNEYLKQGNVFVTEKVDGSMFGFGLNEAGVLQYRSKGQFMHEDPKPPELFRPAINGMLSRESLIRDYLEPGEWVFGETLASPRHNTLCYERVPESNLILFGFWTKDGWETYPEIKSLAYVLGYEIVPLLGYGSMPDLPMIEKLLETDSILGKEKIEGIVIRHETAFWPGFGEPLPVMVKCVRADFKEKNHAAWQHEKASPSNKIDLILQQYCTEARWQKAVQHLREANVLVGAMQDMPKLIQEVEHDVLDENKQEILDEIFKAVSKDLKRVVTRGIAEWYKKKLMEEAYAEVSETAVGTVS